MILVLLECSIELRIKGSIHLHGLESSNNGRIPLKVPKLSCGYFLVYQISLILQEVMLGYQYLDCTTIHLIYPSCSSPWDPIGILLGLLEFSFIPLWTVVVIPSPRWLH